MPWMNRTWPGRSMARLRDPSAKECRRPGDQCWPLPNWSTTSPTSRLLSVTTSATRVVRPWYFPTRMILAVELTGDDPVSHQAPARHVRATPQCPGEMRDPQAAARSRPYTPTRRPEERTTAAASTRSGDRNTLTARVRVSPSRHAPRRGPNPARGAVCQTLVSPSANSPVVGPGRCSGSRLGRWRPAPRTLNLKAAPWKIANLAALKRDGRLHLPDLQRGFVWSADRVRALYDSLYRSYPVGALLLWEPKWEGEAPFSTRAWDICPPDEVTSRGTPEPPRPVAARLAVRAGRAAAADVDLPAGVSQPDPQQDHARSGPAGGACRRATSGWRTRFTCARRRCTAGCERACWCRRRCCSRGSAAATRAWRCNARSANG